MFESHNYIKPSFAGIVLDQADQKANAIVGAQQLFDTATLHGWTGRARALLLRNPNRLLDLNSVIDEGQVRARHYAGVRAVPIDQIRGSEGRTADFDASFNPLSRRSRFRWQNIAQAALQDVPLPPVELIQVGDVYFVRDGHHRISVARHLGQTAIDAEVIVLEIQDCPSTAFGKAFCPA